MDKGKMDKGKNAFSFQFEKVLFKKLYQNLLVGILLVFPLFCKKGRQEEMMVYITFPAPEKLITVSKGKVGKPQFLWYMRGGAKYHFGAGEFHGKIYLIDTYNRLKTRKGIMIGEEGFLIGKLRVDENERGEIVGVKGFTEDVLFFKYPAQDGEKYNMAQYIKKYTGKSWAENIPVSVSVGEVEFQGKITSAQIHSINLKEINPKLNYTPKFFIVDNVGIVKTENFDKEGEIVVMEKSEKFVEEEGKGKKK